MSYRILHLFPNLMNLYGDYANLSILSHYMTEEGFSHALTFSDLEGDFSGYDMIYIGSGTERASFRALELLAACWESLSAFINRGGRLLLTGTAMDLFRESIEDDRLGTVSGLAVIPGKVTRSHEKRYLSDVLYQCSAVESTIIGFVNTSSVSSNTGSPLFFTSGECNPSGTAEEGYLSSSLLATGLTGPLLIKNPALCRWYLDSIYQDTDFHPSLHADMSVQQSAYDAACQELLELRKKM